MQRSPPRSTPFALALAVGLIACSAPRTPHPSAPCASGSSASAPSPPASLPTSFRWSSSEPLITAHGDEHHPLISIKDPSLVFFQNRWHVFATTANALGAWSMVYLSFADWSQAASAPQHYLGDEANLGGYHCAPQVFFFRPQNRWYLIFQSGQPQYTTTNDIGNPSSWAPPRDFFASEPAIVREHKGSGGWLDFAIICDQERCYLFFTDDNGEFYRSSTRLADFPDGFGEPVIAMQGTKATLFESGQTYRVEETGQYLTLIEAFGPAGQRYFRSFVADRLDGEWTPLAASWENPFAGSENVTFAGGRAWTRDISHGELLRTNYDQTPTVSLARLQFLYQGVDAAAPQGDYFRIPWQLALLTRAP